MPELRSYSSPFALGHKAVMDIWNGIVYIQEKIDGSQISWGVRDGVLHCRSRNQDLSHTIGTPAAAGMFQKAIETINALYPKLVHGWTYRGEYLGKAKQNTLKYDRVPKQNIILFDIDIADQNYMEPGMVAEAARHLGLDYAPMFAKLTHQLPLDDLLPYLDNESILGGCKVEGIVLKNYSMYGSDSKVLMAKLVSADFREMHGGDWKQRNPSKSDIIQQLIERYGTEARWRKAVQHLREEGKILDEPKDIGLLIGEIPNDILSEHADEIKDALFKAFIKDLTRGWTRGMPEWYKRQLTGEVDDSSQT